MISSTAPSPSSVPARPSTDRLRPDLPRVVLFVALAVATTSTLSIPFAAGLLPESAVGLVVPLAQLSPLVAALVVRRRTEPWQTSLGLSVPSWRRLALAGLLGLAAMALVPLARIGLGLALGAPLADGAADAWLGLLAAVPVILVLQSVFAIGEEAGWRGWLHRELSPLGFWPAAGIIGGLWALWHLPIVLALGLEGREAVTYLVTIAAVAPLLSALRETAGTAWAAVIAHGMLNSVRVAIDQNVLGPLDPTLAWALDAVSWAGWVLAAALVLRAARRSPADASMTGRLGAPGKAAPAQV